MSVARHLAVALALALAAGCGGPGEAPSAGRDAAAVERFHGTREPFASEAVYFVVTDRFVNGDPSNDQRDQGGQHPTFDRPITCPDGVVANVGYLGGDFRGLLDNAGYIAGMGFTAVWLTPIVENPSQAFTGGGEISCGSSLTDRGKAGYHGYWGVNFHRLDPHLPSPGLDFEDLTRGLRSHGLKTVLDAVINHASPGWTMPGPQPGSGFGQVFDADGRLLADHMNLPPERLDPDNEPLHRFFSTRPDLAQLADFDLSNPEVMDHLVDAYLMWIGQGADALRMDTLGHVALEHWAAFTARIREHHPDLFMFGEAFSFDAADIARYTLPENGGMSVLDFPLKQAMAQVFGREGAGFDTLQPLLFLDGGPYRNPYELALFYDNHDVARLDADDAGFINAHNWLFTARGFPVVYYGSETGFMRGRAEHAGNRNYFGQARIDAAATHPIHQALTRVARLRGELPALQRGLMLVLSMHGDQAAFLRVLQEADTAQTVLVVLNKAPETVQVELDAGLQPGTWRDALDGGTVTVGDAPQFLEVPANGLRALVFDRPLDHEPLLQRLRELQAVYAGAD